jgi:dihydrolipoamide dehydrogenase
MQQFDVIIIGVGPGGMDAAKYAIAQGRNTLLVERDLLGGTCLNRGCIPTKALCHWADLVREVPGAVTWAAAQERKNAVVEQLRSNVETAMQKATIVRGEARFVDAHTIAVGEEQFTAPQIVVATGSRPAALPIPGAETALTSDDILALESLPQSICVIGGGVIGIELACILHDFGVAVTVVEYCKEILPNFDREVAKRLRTALTRRGITIVTSAQVTAIADSGRRVIYQAKGREAEVEAECTLMAVGRRAVVPEGLEAVGVKLHRGAIEVDPATMQTAVDGIYAIGDANAMTMLAHVASAQAKRVFGGDIRLDVVPAAVFSSPECSMVGLTEEQCAERGLNFKVAKAMFRSNGKALSMEQPDGLVKLIIDADSRTLLGAHICGAHAADLIQELALCISANLTIDALTRTIHAHPTLGEVVLAAASSL